MCIWRHSEHRRRGGWLTGAANGNGFGTSSTRSLPGPRPNSTCIGRQRSPKRRRTASCATKPTGGYAIAAASPRSWPSAMGSASAISATPFERVNQGGNTMGKDTLRGYGKSHRQPEKWRADPFVVIPAKAGIQLFERLLDSGSSLRCGRNNEFYLQRAFFSSLLRVGL